MQAMTIDLCQSQICNRVGWQVTAGTMPSRVMIGSMIEQTYWVTLTQVKHLSGQRLRALLDRFGTVEQVLQADTKQLRAVRGIGRELAARIQALDVAAVAAQMAHWRAQGVRILTWQDDEYPRRLAALGDAAPPTIYIIGQILSSLPAVAIVGTRTPTAGNFQLARALGQRYAQQGYMVGSGLALGVDTGAHGGALLARGHTVAVLGSGVLNVYPPENRALSEYVQQHGALISEQPPYEAVSTQALVARNRLITACVDAVVIVQTDSDGGAMHAARFAQAQGRPLYVLDAPFSGNRSLLAAGYARPFAANFEGLP
jgi:DNA processing protein